MTLCRRIRAFTLVEMIVVVVIIAITAAVVLPSFGSRDSLKLSAAARTLLADLSYAQSRAITSQKKQYVQFVGQQYFILSRSTDAAPLVQIAHPVNPGNYVVTLDTSRYAGVKLDTCNFGGKQIIGFDTLGSPLAYDTSANTSTPLTSAGTIKLTCGNAELTVTIEPYTGETSVSEN